MNDSPYDSIQFFFFFDKGSSSCLFLSRLICCSIINWCSSFTPRLYIDIVYTLLRNWTNLHKYVVYIPPCSSDRIVITGLCYKNHLSCRVLFDSFFSYIKRLSFNRSTRITNPTLFPSSLLSSFEFLDERFTFISFQCHSGFTVIKF